MINMRSLALELIVLAVIGLSMQNAFFSGNLNGNGLFNQYLGFSLLFPLYGLILSRLIDSFRLKNTFSIVLLSIVVLVFVTIVNIILYPMMGGSTSKMYGAWALFYLLPSVSLPLGLIYGIYKANNQKQRTEKRINTNQVKTLEDDNSNKLGAIWIIGIFFIFVLPYFIYMSHNNSHGTVYIRLLLPLENYFSRLIFIFISIGLGVGILYRLKFMRWGVLFFVYFATIKFIIIIFLNPISFSLEPQSIVAFSIPFLFIHIFYQDKNFEIYGLNKTIWVKEMLIMMSLAILYVAFQFIYYKFLG